ncbi:MAG: LLM class flavin-dependent oxidoreductase, partial [Mycobacterium sp.]|uniref:LLM class flavin-dependent oxidoreductase n=1 Tax=Mycobacterium sp. TaxID=1785 RepID=UPI001EB3F629
MKVHLQVDGSPTQATASATEIAATGADGLFTFEGQHDVFFPLIVAAGATRCELMTNVAIAPPRSPLHLAHAAYDVQLYSGGRFRLGLGS